MVYLFQIFDKNESLKKEIIPNFIFSLNYKTINVHKIYDTCIRYRSKKTKILVIHES